MAIAGRASVSPRCAPITASPSTSRLTTESNRGLTSTMPRGFFKVAPKTLRVAAEADEIEALHPLPDGPWIFSRAVLSTAPARAITDRARQNPRHPAGAAVLPGKLDNIGGETLLVVTTARDLALRRAMLPERRTGT